MGHPIFDDSGSVEKRNASVTGFIDTDVPLLTSLGIVKVENGQQTIRKNLVKDPVDIRNFLAWAAGDRKIPLPPLARRILCLKRAIIKNSIASVSTSSHQRTGEKAQLDEIDSLLRADGGVNLDNKDKCVIEGSTFIPKAVGGLPATKQIETVCVADREVLELLREIKEGVDRLEEAGGKGPLAFGRNIHGLNDSFNSLSLQEELNQLSGSNQEIELKPLLSELKEEVAEIPALHTLVENIEEDSSKSDIIERLMELQRGIDAMKNTSPVAERLRVYIKGRMKKQPMILAELAKTKASILEAIAAIEKAPDNYDQIVQDLESKVQPHIESVQTALSDTLRNISSSVEQLSTNTMACDAELEQTLLNMNTKLDEISSKIESKEAAITDGISASMETLKHLIENTKCEPSDITPIKSALDKYMAQIEERLSQLEKTNATGINNAKISEIEELRNQVATLKTNIGKQSVETDLVAELERKLAASEEELEKLRGESVGKNGSIRTITAAIEAKNRLIAEKEQEVARKGNELEVLRAKCSKERSSADEQIRKLDMEAKRIEQTIPTLDIELERLRKLAAKNDAALSSLVDSIAEKKREIASLVGQGVAKEARVRELTVEVETGETEIARVKSETARLKEQIEEYGKQKELYKTMLRDSTAAKTELESKKQALEAAIAEKSNNIDALRASLSSSIETYTGKMEQRNAEYRRELEQLTQRFASQIQTLGDSSVAELKAKLAENAKEKARLGVEMGELIKKYNEYKMYVEQMQEQCARKEQEKDAIIHDLKLKLSECNAKKSTSSKTYDPYTKSTYRSIGGVTRKKAHKKNRYTRKIE